MAKLKTYILELKNGNVRRIKIPSHWKLTFGSVIPFHSRGMGGESRGVALRLYEGSKENLRAVMTDVVSIRDESIGILEKRHTVQRKASQRATPKGMKDVVIEARMTEWVNPDVEDEGETPEEFLSLTAPGEKEEPAF